MRIRFNQRVSFLHFLPLLLFFLVAQSTGTDENRVTRSVKEEILSLLIEDSEVRAFAGIEIPSGRNVTLYDDFLSLHLFDGQDLLFNGVRSEVTVNFPFAEHDTVVYEWDILIPPDFQHDSPENRWWNMGQWHDQPDLTLGETWADLPARSPVMSLHLKFYDGSFYFAPRYMHVEPPFEDLVLITPGEWMKLKFEICWSLGDDGYMKLWVDDSREPDIFYTGPNMHNGYQHYLKVGMYRHPDIVTDNTISLRNLDIYMLNENRLSIRNHRCR